MFAVIDVLVTNRFVVCCDTYILIADTKQYDNIQNKTAKKVGYLEVLKSQ